MPPKITRVRWRASNLPWGISFDEATGTFSGTPEDVGEYTIPVTVETNYGSDNKNVMFNVCKVADVYSIGNKAATWSNGAEADKYGFRKLNIPKASKLYFTYEGFGAKTLNDFYVCGIHAGTLHLNDSELDINTPTKLPIDNVMEICGDTTNNSTGAVAQITAYRTSNNEYLFSVANSNYSTISYQQYHSYEDMGYKLSDIDGNSHYCVGIGSDKHTIVTFGSVTGAIYWKSFSVDKEIKKAYSAVKVPAETAETNLKYVYYLTSDGELWSIHYKGDESPQRLCPELGEIKDFWVVRQGPTLFVLTKNNTLYTKGYCNNYFTGLPGSTLLSDFTEVGLYAAKKITSGCGGTFMLTEDGALYFSGTGSVVSSITSQSSGYSRIFSEYTFLDFAYLHDSKTLTVLRE